MRSHYYTFHGGVARMVKAGLILLALAVASPFDIRAEIAVSGLFSDGLILQRDKPMNVWGSGSPGERVRVQFHGQSVETTTNASGRWQVVLSAEPASTEPSELVVAGTNTVRVADVLVGDVWLCSGQSNMAFVVSRGLNARVEIAAADDPLIRQFEVARVPNAEPQEDCQGSWQSASPETVANFTAVGYFFAREWRARTGVPVALVNAAVGGTPIESWMSAEALSRDPSAETIHARWEQAIEDYPTMRSRYEVDLAAWEAAKLAAENAGEVFKQRRPAKVPDPLGGRRLAGLYNGMIHPLHRVGLRGILWYQGEANGERGGEYRTLFPNMIEQWRRDFQQGDLPFGFVQLPNCERHGRDPSGEAWAHLREAQAGALRLPATGMAVTIDVGNPKNVHPKNKQDVGLRLSLWARATLLGEPVAYAGPRFNGVEREGRQLRVRFLEAAGLTATNGVLTGFEVADGTRTFVPATARLDGQTVMVSAPGIETPVAVRYAWENAPQASLFNAAGLPAAPFRSEAW